MHEKNMLRKSRSDNRSLDGSENTTRDTSPSAESRHFISNQRGNHLLESPVEQAQLQKKLHALENRLVEQTSNLIKKGVLPAQREIIQAFPITEITISENQRPDHKTVANGLVVHYLAHPVADRSENSPNIVYGYLEKISNIERNEPEGNEKYVAKLVRQWLQIIDKNCAEILQPSPEDTRTREEHVQVIELTIKQMDETTHTLFMAPQTYRRVNEILRDLHLRKGVFPWEQAEGS